MSEIESANVILQISAWVIAITSFSAFCFLLTKISESKRIGENLPGITLAARADAGVCLIMTLFALATAFSFHWDELLYPICGVVMVVKMVSLYYLCEKERVRKEKIATGIRELRRMSDEISSGRIANGARH